MTSAPKPVLTPEDEAYLREVTAQVGSEPIPTEQNGQTSTGSATGASLQPATSEPPENIPLPTSPGEELGKELGEEGRQERRSSQPTLARSETPKSEVSKPSQKKKRWSTMFWKKNTAKVGHLFVFILGYLHLARVCTNIKTPRTKPQLLRPHQIHQQMGKTQTKIKMQRI
jgi:hypothetical protein